MMNKKDNPLMSRSKETNITSGALYGFVVWFLVLNPIILVFFNKDKGTLSMYLKKIQPISVESDHDVINFTFEDTTKKPMRLKVEELKGMLIINDTDTFNGDTIINKSKLVKSYPVVKNGLIYVGSLGAKYYLEITKADYKKLPPLYRKEAGKLYSQGSTTPITKDIKIYIGKDGTGSSNRDTIDSIFKK